MWLKTDTRGLSAGRRASPYCRHTIFTVRMSLLLHIAVYLFNIIFIWRIEIILGQDLTKIQGLFFVASYVLILGIAVLKVRLMVAKYNAS